MINNNIGESVNLIRSGGEFRVKNWRFSCPRKGSDNANLHLPEWDSERVGGARLLPETTNGEEQNQRDQGIHQCG